MGVEEKKHTEEWKKFHTQRMKGNTFNTGRKWDKLVVEKRASSNSKAQKGKKLSAEHEGALAFAWPNEQVKISRSKAIKKHVVQMSRALKEEPNGQ